MNTIMLVVFSFGIDGTTHNLHTIILYHFPFDVNDKRSTPSDKATRTEAQIMEKLISIWLKNDTHQPTYMLLTSTTINK